MDLLRASNAGCPGARAPVEQAARPVGSTRQKPWEPSATHRWPAVPAGPGSETAPLGAVNEPLTNVVLIAADARPGLKAIKRRRIRAVARMCGANLPVREVIEIVVPFVPRAGGPTGGESSRSAGRGERAAVGGYRDPSRSSSL